MLIWPLFSHFGTEKWFCQNEALDYVIRYSTQRLRLVLSIGGVQRISNLKLSKVALEALRHDFEVCATVLRDMPTGTARERLAAIWWLLMQSSLPGEKGVEYNNKDLLILMEKDIKIAVQGNGKGTVANHEVFEKVLLAFPCKKFECALCR